MRANTMWAWRSSCDLATLHPCDLDFPWVKARAISLTLVPVLRMTDTATRNANSCFSIALVLNSCHMYILTSFFPLKLGQKWVYWIHWSGSSFHVTSVERSRRSPVEIERSYPTVPEHTLNENPVVKISVPRAALLPLPRSLSPSRHPLLKTLWNTPLSPESLQCCLCSFDMCRGSPLRQERFFLGIKLLFCPLGDLGQAFLLWAL